MSGELAQDETTEDSAPPYIVNIPDGMEGKEWADLIGQHLRMYSRANPSSQDFNQNVYLAAFQSQGIVKGAIIGLHNLPSEGQDHIKSFASKYVPGSCIICAEELGRHTNNAEPFMSGGNCCDACNQAHVIPHRMYTMLQMMNRNSRSPAA
jgi:hypothetical protein